MKNGIIKVYTVEGMRADPDSYKIKVVGIHGDILFEKYTKTKTETMANATFWNNNTGWPIKDFGVI